MTQEEKQSIVNDVLEAIRTNAVTIGQLTPVSGLSDADSFEISGGRRVDFKVLKNAVQNMPLKNLAKIEELLIQYGLSPQEKEMVKSSVVKAESAMEMAESAIGAAESAEAMAETLAESVGKSSGIAPLDAAGVIPTRYIPGSMDDVKEFTEIMPTIKETSGTTDLESTNPITDVIYMPFFSAFGLRVRTLDGGLMYYEKWGDDNLYNSVTPNGPCPLTDKIYVCKQDNMAYRWSGSTLVALGSALALGYTASTAFPGDEGQQLKDNLNTLAGRHNALADTVAAFPKFLPIDGQLTKEYIDQDGREPESGVWLVPSPDEGCWYFQSYGDTDWYGHAEEEYNSDLQYIPGLMYIYKNQIATIENDTIKVMGSELVKAIQDADEAKVPGLYVLRNGEPLLVTREANKNARTWTYTQLMLSNGGVVTRTATIPIPLASGAVPSEIEWEDWQSLQGGGISTESADNIDNLFEPNIYKLDDGSILIVHTLPKGPGYVFQKLIDTYDIKTRSKIADEDWLDWEPLNSVKKAKATADNALATANDATTKAVDALNAFSEIEPSIYRARLHSNLSTDVGILYNNGTSLSFISLNDYLISKQEEGVEAIVLKQGARTLLLHLDVYKYKKIPFCATSTVLYPRLTSIYDMLNDWDGIKNTVHNRNVLSKMPALDVANSRFSTDSFSTGRWWLPSLAELLFIYNNTRKVLYVTASLRSISLTGIYWSSTVYDESKAFALNMDTGEILILDKTATANICSVTYFLNNDLFGKLYENLLYMQSIGQL